MATDTDLRTASAKHFKVELSLPTGPPEYLINAAEAVKNEYRDSTKLKRLCCRKVYPLADSDGEAIFVLELGQSVEFDWTWEGAVAFRPRDIQNFDLSSEISSGSSTDDIEKEAWSGEVIEVDEVSGRIFVWLNDPHARPTTGSFYIRPFEFLAFLYSVYCESGNKGLQNRLPQRLNACRGGVHPPTSSPDQPSLPHLSSLWNHAWGVLWGPPGTGKTYNVGQQIAACITDPTERILIVSTTNKATDEAALSCGRALRENESPAIAQGDVRRIGKSAHYDMFKEQGLLDILKGTETALLHQIGVLTKQINQAKTHELKAVFRQKIQALKRQMKDASFNIFVSLEVKVVLATSFKAITLLNSTEINSAICDDFAPFTTIFIDEAGLVSRATAAALSLLASRRVVLCGDPKQLAPISNISRVLPTKQAKWLASSGLNHLHSLNSTNPAIHLIQEQHRMHPNIRAVVSAFQYDNVLTDGSTVLKRQNRMPDLITNQPRAIWYVLDEDNSDLAHIRAEHGPGNRSWCRPATRRILKKFFADNAIRQGDGLFITPFVAQARDIRSFLADEHLDSSWSSATVHSQQGTQKDFVIFDTVNAGSCGWPCDEWKRLVNVGLSRAKEFVMLLASRSEMKEPYLISLSQLMAPKILKWSGSAYKFVNVPADVVYAPPTEIAENPELLGNQLLKRKQLRPVLSSEQQRLCNLRLDGKPRLVRGVAGSGKTAVLAHWLVNTLQAVEDQPDARLWVVYANKSLRALLTRTMLEAWNEKSNGKGFPWSQVKLWHVSSLFWRRFNLCVLNYDYDSAAQDYLTTLNYAPKRYIESSCHAMFIDEAQDMGQNTLQLLSALVDQTDENDANSRSVNIFYDNAQNVYGRSTPKWVDIGLGMQGRSSIMKQCFRSTKPISEYALNVLYRLEEPNSDDHKELIKLNLIEKCQRHSKVWWKIRFNQVEGPNPNFRLYKNRHDELEAVSNRIVSWVRDEGVRPNDICLIYNNKQIAQQIKSHLAPKLEKISVAVAIETGQVFTADPRTVTVTTSQSFKGYDAEIVVIPGVDQFISWDSGILASSLYVAMTRARSILEISGVRQSFGEKGQLLSTLQECIALLVERDGFKNEAGDTDEFEDIVGLVGNENRNWLEELWNQFSIEQEPIISADGEILAEPLFWFKKKDDSTHACFGIDLPSQLIQFRLEDEKITIIKPGMKVD